MRENSGLDRRRFLRLLGVAGTTTAAATGTVAAACGDRYTTTSYQDSLSGDYDSNCHVYSWEFADPCKVTVTLGGYGGDEFTNNDFDLLVNDGRTECSSTTGDADYASWDNDPSERVVIDNPDTSTDLYITVKSFRGSSPYFLTVREETY